MKNKFASKSSSEHIFEFIVEFKYHPLYLLAKYPYAIF